MDSLKFKNFLISISKKDLIYILIISILLFLFCFLFEKYSNVNYEYKNNISALNDSIHYYKSKNGKLIATKLAFETDIKNLKLLNSDLYNEIKVLKSKDDIVNATNFGGIIEYEKHDTTYIVKYDTINNGFIKDFSINNEYRTLEGNVNYSNDTLGFKINKDEMYFDYTVAMDEKNNIYITSSNPYVKYNKISGFHIPKQRTKKWSLGPSVNFGYDPVNNKPSFSFGVSLNYGIFQW